MAPVITSRDELLALLADLDAATSREAVERAATGPAEIAAAPARRLYADAPALPPLRMPKLTDRVLNGKRVQELLDAGKKAALVHTPRGVRVVPDVAEVADDPAAVVLAQWREVSRAVTIDGQSARDVAIDILDRELDVCDRLARAAA